LQGLERAKFPNQSNRISLSPTATVLDASSSSSTLNTVQSPLYPAGTWGAVFEKARLAGNIIECVGSHDSAKLVVASKASLEGFFKSRCDFTDHYNGFIEYALSKECGPIAYYQFEGDLDSGTLSALFPAHQQIIQDVCLKFPNVTLGLDRNVEFDRKFKDLASKCQFIW